MYEKCSALNMYLLQRIDSIPKWVIYDNIYELVGYCRQTTRRWVKQLFGGGTGTLTPVELIEDWGTRKDFKRLQSVEHHYRLLILSPFLENGC